MVIMSTQVSTTDPEKKSRRSVPAAAFIVGFGALLIVCLVLAIGVVNYESSAEERASSRSATATSTTSSEALPTVTTVINANGETSVSRPPKPAPPETSEEQVRASIRTRFIADAKTARTNTGVAVTGDVTEQALDDLPEFTAHVSRLLEQNCVDSMALTTPDNERVTFNGFCYTTMPGETFQRMLTIALEGEADSIDFANNPAYGNANYVSMTWYVANEKEAERIHETWHSVRRPRAVEQILFYTYSPEKVHRLVKERGRADAWRHDEVF